MDDRHASDEVMRLEEQAARSGMRIAVDRIDGHWRAGFLVTNELGEAEFALHATGPDQGTAIRRLAEMAAGLGCRLDAGAADPSHREQGT